MGDNGLPNVVIVRRNEPGYAVNTDSTPPTFDRHQPKPRTDAVTLPWQTSVRTRVNFTVARKPGSAPPPELVYEGPASSFARPLPEGHNYTVTRTRVPVTGQDAAATSSPARRCFDADAEL